MRSAKPSTTGTKPCAKVYRLRLRAVDHDDDDIRHLRAVLKQLLRRYRFRVIELEQEQAL
jgi:hypothetical protein